MRPSSEQITPFCLEAIPSQRCVQDQLRSQSSAASQSSHADFQQGWQDPLRQQHPLKLCENLSQAFLPACPEPQLRAMQQCWDDEGVPCVSQENEDQRVRLPGLNRMCTAFCQSNRATCMLALWPWSKKSSGPD